MQYRSIADLSDAIARNLSALPGDVDLVVGVPRSGLLAANIIALTLNAPLTDVEGLKAGRILASGRTRRRASFDQSAHAFRSILVVDDSVNTGESLRAVRAELAGATGDAKVTYCVVYGVEPRHPDADIVLEAVPQPRMFQWNLMHHSLLRYCCVDIDGVLCVDPTQEENDDGENYVRFLGAATPYLAPSKEIGWLVTSRLEKYRAQTEAWLTKHGVRYGELIMLDLPNKEARQRAGAHGAFKADAYAKRDAILFIESEYAQACDIAQRAGKPVLCVEAQQIIEPDPRSPKAIAQRIATLPNRLKAASPPPVAMARRIVRRLRKTWRGVMREAQA